MGHHLHWQEVVVSEPLGEHHWSFLSKLNWKKIWRRNLFSGTLHNRCVTFLSNCGRYEPAKRGWFGVNENLNTSATIFSCSVVTFLFSRGFTRARIILEMSKMRDRMSSLFFLVSYSATPIRVVQSEKKDDLLPRGSATEKLIWLPAVKRAAGPSQQPLEGPTEICQCHQEQDLNPQIGMMAPWNVFRWRTMYGLRTSEIPCRISMPVEYNRRVAGDKISVWWFI